MHLPSGGNNQLHRAGFDWIALKVICQGQKGLICHFSTILTFFVYLFKICYVTVFLCWHETFPGWWQWTVKRRILLNHSKGHSQGQKGQVWLIFTYLSILICSPEVLPKCIVLCSFSGVILVLFSNFNGVDRFQRLFSRSEMSNLDLCYLFRPISKKRCMVWPMFVWNTCMKSYMIYQLTLWPLTLDNP